MDLTELWTAVGEVEEFPEQRFAELADDVRGGGACPTQYTGVLRQPVGDKTAFYFRFRHGLASLGVGTDTETAVADPAAVWFRIQPEGSYGDGTMSKDEFIPVFVGMLQLRRRYP